MQLSALTSQHEFIKKQYMVNEAVVLINTVYRNDISAVEFS